MANKILIIEDEEVAANLLVKRLSEQGFETMSVRDAQSGIKQAHQFKPDVIILDLLLPGGGGEGVLRNLELSVYTNKIPVIISSAVEEESIRYRLLNYKIAAYLHKPLDTNLITSEINKILARPGKAVKTKKKIIIVDDDADIFQAVEYNLVAGGIEVISAKDYGQALTQVQLHWPDLVLIDLNTDNPTFRRLIKKLREEGTFKSIPIVLIQGEDETESWEGLRPTDCLLNKPFDSDQLLDKIYALLDDR